MEDKYVWGFGCLIMRGVGWGNSRIKKWSILGVRLLSCGCTREAGRAREKCFSSFSSALPTSQVHP